MIIQQDASYILASSVINVGLGVARDRQRPATALGRYAGAATYGKAVRIGESHSYARLAALVRYIELINASSSGLRA